MNISDLATQLLFVTTPIWTERWDGRKTSGTAFFVNWPVPGEADISVPLLVTAAHVVEEAKRGIIALSRRAGDIPKQGEAVRVEVDADFFAGGLKSDLDLFAAPIAPILQLLEEQEQPIFYRAVTPDLMPSRAIVDDLSALEEVTFIGYPSGLFDEKNVSSVIRRGITASPPWNDFEGEPIFLIDAGVFPGSSGSPVFILNQGSYPTKDGIAIGSRLLFLGMITESVLRVEGQDRSIYLGLGRVLKTTQIQRVIGDYVAALQRG